MLVSTAPKWKLLHTGQTTNFLFFKKNIYLFYVSFGLLLFFMANSSKSNLGSHSVLFMPVCDRLKDCRDFVDTFHGLFF